MDFTLNIEKKHGKVKKKPAKSVEQLTRMQNVNPDFNFAWNNTPNISQGKVFARKRQKPQNKNIENPQNTKSLNKNFNTKINSNNSPENKNKKNEKAFQKQKIDNFNKTKENLSENQKKQDGNNSFEPQKKMNPKNPIQDDTINFNKQNNNHQKTQKFNHIDSGNSEEHQEKSSQGHIKRKQKKDKLLAKQEGTEIKVPQKEHREYSLFSHKEKPIYVETSGKGKSVSEKVFTGGQFKDLDIHKHLISNLEKFQFTELTNVQKKSIPVAMSGKNVLIRSQTGSGKTLAYAVPIIDALQGITPRLKRSDGVQAIIVVPTRELALQTHELFSKINTFQWVVVGHLCGGENRKSEKDRIRKGINVLIGTPGRLLDHVLHTEALKVNNVRCLVLDEADRLLDMGFRKDIISLVEELDRAKIYSEYNPMQMLKKSQNTIETEDKSDSSDLPPLKTPENKKRQTLLLSATLTKEVSELADFTMKDHIFIDALDQTSNAIVDSYVIPDTVKQEFIMVYPKHRLFTLSALLASHCKKNSKVFVFMASMQMVEFHYELFTKYFMKMPVNRGKPKQGHIAILDESDDSDEEEEEVLETEFFKLHGSMDQKMRKEVFIKFRAAKKGILICTDVAARGIDVPEADCIVQYTGPQSDEDYLHRVGRTGRAGKSGSAIIFLTHEEQQYVTHLKDHRVFLKNHDPEDYLQNLCELMEETDHEKAATLLQKRYESAVLKDKDLYKLACFAFSTWSRYYSSYPAKLRNIFNSKNVNLGHYVTSFALRETPTHVAQVVRGQVSHIEAPRLNKKLANHPDNPEIMKPQKKKTKKVRSLSLTTSEFSSGLEPMRKKSKKE